MKKILFIIIICICLTGCSNSNQKVNNLVQSSINDRVKLISDWYSNSEFIVKNRKDIYIQGKENNKPIKVAPPVKGSVFATYDTNLLNKNCFSNYTSAEAENLYVISSKKLLDKQLIEDKEDNIEIVLNKINNSIVYIELDNKEIGVIPNKIIYNYNKSSWENELNIFYTEDIINALNALLIGKNYYNVIDYDKSINVLTNTLIELSETRSEQYGALPYSINKNGSLYQIENIYPFTFTNSVVELYNTGNVPENCKIILKKYMEWVNEKLNNTAYWNTENIPFTGVTFENEKLRYSKNTNSWDVRNSGSTTEILEMLYGFCNWNVENVGISSNIEKTIIARKTFNNWIFCSEITSNNEVAIVGYTTNVPISYLIGYFNIKDDSVNVQSLFSKLATKQTLSGDSVSKGSFRASNLVDIKETLEIINTLINIY